MRSSTKIDWAVYTPFEQKVLRLVKKIPKGQVLTYSQVARRLGNSNLARAVGRALSRNQHAPTIPCHRVVGYNSIGGYSAKGGIRAKKDMLKKEGYE